MTNFDFLLSSTDFAPFGEAAVAAEKIYGIDPAACVMTCWRAYHRLCQICHLDGTGKQIGSVAYSIRNEFTNAVHGQLATYKIERKKSRARTLQKDPRSG